MINAFSAGVSKALTGWAMRSRRGVAHLQDFSNGHGVWCNGFSGAARSGCGDAQRHRGHRDAGAQWRRQSISMPARRAASTTMRLAMGRRSAGCRPGADQRQGGARRRPVRHRQQQHHRRHVGDRVRQQQGDDEQRPGLVQPIPWLESSPEPPVGQPGVLERGIDHEQPQNSTRVPSRPGSSPATSGSAGSSTPALVSAATSRASR